MKNEIRITQIAEKELQRLPRAISRRISEKILLLSNDPKPRGCMQISGYPNYFRIRIGSYRVVYEYAKQIKIVVIVRVGHRRDIYKKFR